MKVVGVTAVIDWIGAAALVLTSNGIVWMIMQERLNSAQGAQEALRVRISGLEGLVKQEHAKRLSSVESGQADVRRDVASLVADKDSVVERVASLESRVARPSTASWDVFVGSVSDCISVMRSRMEWHLGWLERLSREVSLDRAAELTASDMRLSAMLIPRQSEIDICTPSRKFKSAVQFLVDGEGDQVSLERMRLLFQDDQEFRVALDRLAARLAESVDGQHRPARSL